MNNASENTKKEFTRVLRGYAPNEVEEYISSLAKDKDRMNKYIAELEKRVSYLSKQNNILKQTNATPKYILDEARGVGEEIIDKANEEAAIIIGAAKTSCDNLLNEFRFRMGEEKKKLLALQATVQEFKTNLYIAYQKHIDVVEGITDTADIEALKLDAEAYSQKVVADIKTEVAYLTAELKQRQERASADKIEDEYFANREAELEAELKAERSNKNKKNKETVVFNSNMDLSNLPDTAENEIDGEVEIESYGDDEEAQTSDADFFETDDDMTLIDSTGGFEAAAEDVDVQDKYRALTVNNEISVFEDDGKSAVDEAPFNGFADGTDRTEKNSIEDAYRKKSIFPEEKIPDLIYPSGKSKKKKNKKKSEAMMSYDDILESFAKELGEGFDTEDKTDNDK